MRANWLNRTTVFTAIQFTVTTIANRFIENSLTLTGITIIFNKMTEPVLKQFSDRLMLNVVFISQIIFRMRLMISRNCLLIAD